MLLSRLFTARASVVSACGVLCTTQSVPSTPAALRCGGPLQCNSQAFHAPQVLGFHRKNQGDARDVAHPGLHDFFDGLPMGPFERGELDRDGQCFSHADDFTALAGLILISSPPLSSRFNAAGVTGGLARGKCAQCACENSAGYR